MSIYWGKFFRVNIPILSKSIISFLEPKRSSNTTKARLQYKRKKIITQKINNKRKPEKKKKKPEGKKTRKSLSLWTELPFININNEK